METLLLKPIGFCLGVVEAIKQAKEIKTRNQNCKVYVLGQLVHNNDVINDLNKYGVITIDTSKVNPIEILENIDDNCIIIFTAHGHPKSYEEILSKRNITFYDTTCPRVKDNLRLIKENLTNGVIYIGKKNHPETIAALSVDKNVYFYDIERGFDFTKCQFLNPIVVNQTTLSFLEISDIHQNIKKHIPHAVICDEICDATKLRQIALKNIDKKWDLIIIVGSERSSNTEKLFQVSKEYHPNSCCLKVDNVEKLKNMDLSNYHRALIASGTSTPYEKIVEIEKYLKEL